MTTFPKNDRTFVTRILDSRSNTFKCRLTNTTNFILTSSIPSPSSNTMEPFNSDTQSRRGAYWIITRTAALDDGCIALSLSWRHDNWDALFLTFSNSMVSSDRCFFCLFVVVVSLLFQIPNSISKKSLGWKTDGNSLYVSYRMLCTTRCFHVTMRTKSSNISLNAFEFWLGEPTRQKPSKREPYCGFESSLARNCSSIILNFL